MKLLCGDCLEILPTLDANSIDACVTDPPYHLTSIVNRFSASKYQDPEIAARDLSTKPAVYQRAARGFMGKQWDGGDIAFRTETWAAVYRVLKPGAHLIAFGGTRTYHRMACAIEDAGFEIRDQIQWLYGSGFPKSHDVSKGIDRAAGAEREIIGIRKQVIKDSYREMQGRTDRLSDTFSETIPATDAARQWQGWGTALKPANEPIVLARKPLSEKTVAANVLKWGTGAINVDGCRVETQDNRARMNNARTDGTSYIVQRESKFINPGGSGRWPANVIHDGSEEVVGAFPETQTNSTGNHHTGEYGSNGVTGWKQGAQYGGDSGSAARFFYCAKASKQDRNGSKHPTVKPLKLMRYLCRLITPPGGLILDPFAGSGTTGQAASDEGFRAVLIERESEYQGDIKRRVDGQLFMASQ